jgi:uncharacterized protein YpuA (DUF1002 family)
MKFRVSVYVLPVVLVITLLFSGCQPAQPASLSNEQVVQVVDQTLKAIDSGDYQAFTQDFSDEMKTAFTEQQFSSLVTLLHDASGNYTSCAGSTPPLTNNQGYAVYRLPCTFEKEKVVVTITFKVSGDKVEGLFLDSTNLRKASQ